MGGQQSQLTGDPNADQFTVSTGETVELPLECEATAMGTTLTASASALEDWLPDALSPVRITNRLGLVTVAAIDYDRVGEFDPYNEFAVIVPVVERPLVDLPLVGALTGTVGGYVHYLPVTTEPAKALGVEGWGYPKEVADVTFNDQFGRARAKVVADGERVVTLDVKPTSGRDWSVRVPSYTRQDGEWLRTPVELSGEIGVRPFGGASVSVGHGTHWAAEDLRDAALGRVLGRFYAEDLSVKIHAGEPI